ncbi:MULTISPECIES: hypothetical protein [Actinomyces]|uniref:Uncharacterized protein n=1 Tax=Actinomyces respiraculi TaxID=2744574 RepID=A0A7T0LN83_9ACTO|nr:MULTISPECIES: hypothetical protein [Actinomyces]QPL06288.1 hypothetical protein ID810_05145 [Actinomyces respiraculi]
MPTCHIDASLGFMRLPEPSRDIDSYRPGEAALEWAADPDDADLAAIVDLGPSRSTCGSCCAAASSPAGCYRPP